MPRQTDPTNVAFPLPNPQHEKFCEMIAKGRTMNEAYAEAGFVPHRQNAFRLFQKSFIARRVGELRAKIAEQVVVDRGWVMRKLVESYERTSQGEEILDRKGLPTGLRRPDNQTAMKCLELIGKSIGMFIDRKESGRPGDFSALDSRTIEKQLYDEYVNLGLSDDKARALARAASSGQEGSPEGEPGGQPH